MASRTIFRSSSQSVLIKFLSGRSLARILYVCINPEQKFNEYNRGKSPSLTEVLGGIGLNPQRCRPYSSSPSGIPALSLWRGKNKIMGREGLLVVKELKRLKKDNERVQKFMKTHVARLLKSDLLAVLAEFQRQDEIFLALKIFDAVRKEIWYKPDMFLYKDMLITLARNKKGEEAMQVWKDMKAENIHVDQHTYADIIRVFLDHGSPLEAWIAHCCNTKSAEMCVHMSCFGKTATGVRSSVNTGKGKSHRSPNKIVHGFSLVKGKSSHPMEDYHAAEFKKIKGHELGLFAIFDGHLGDNVPSYLQKNLFQNILNEEEFWFHPRRAITKAYEKTDKAILREAPNLGPGGSTAVTAILIDGKKLLVANVGDSRAVLSKNGKASQLSVDHEPGTSAERGSIENRGGFVSNMPGDVPRVDGQLAVSRAFGDKSLKSHLRSDPDVREVDIDLTTEFLILASDGLWKVMGNQEAVDFIKKIRDPQVAAKQLTAEALNRDSKDDISCIVVRFN